MKNKKRLIAIMLITVMLMTSIVTYADKSIKDNALDIIKNTVKTLSLQAKNVESFIAILNDLVKVALAELKDVKETDWFKENLALLYGMKIVEGDGKGNFLPNKEVTGSEYLKMVVVALDNKNYKPLNGSWDKPYIDRALELGLVKKDEIADYRKPLNRYNMARIIVRACKEEYGDYNQYQGNIKDFNSIPTEYREYVLKAYSKGIINGYTDGTFGGEKTMRRSEATAVIARLIDPSQRKEPQKPLTDMPFDERVAELQKVPMKEKAFSKTLYADISETIYMKYKNLGKKIVLTGKSNGIYYDGDGVPESYKWNTPLMLKYGYSGSSYGVSMRRNADEQAFEILKDIIKIFLPEKQDYEKAYALYKEYFNMKPSNDDDCKWFVSADGRTEFQMHNSETGVVCDFFYKGVGK